MAGLYAVLHWVLIAAYLAAPVILLASALVRARIAQRRGEKARAPLASAAATLLAGAGIGAALALIYAQFIARSLGAISIGQLLISAYAGMGLLSILKSLDWLLQLGLARLREKRGWNGPSSASAALFVRVVLLVLVLLPFSMAATMTFRPKVVPRFTPETEIGAPYERVSFTAGDGTRLVGWWIPASLRLDARRPGRSGETVVLAHGLGSGKADMLHIAGAMRGAGYNVLVFDLRAHGESGGQLCSFGVAEARDVEAAAQWVRQAHPGESQRLLGFGASMGAAAMLAARDPATGETPFDAVAVMGTYDDLGLMASTIIRRQFWGPLARVAEWTAVPAASAHAGYDLASFRPADFIQDNWPAPMFVAHGERDEIIPFRSGVRLYNAAFEPKRNWWVDLNHNQILGDPSTLQAVLKFFEDAQLVQRGIV